MTTSKQSSDANEENDEYTLTAADRERFADEHSRGMCPPQDSQLCAASAVVPLEHLRDDVYQRLIARLRAVAGDQRHKGGTYRKRRTLVGLAAPQIGELWRIVLIDTKVDESRSRYGRLECFINPEIIWRSREMAEGREGCYSTGPVWGLVRRPVALKLRAHTPDGAQLERIFEGFTARIICHELDHLDGIRFPERITNDRKRHWVHTEELATYPERIRHWPRLCTMERWLAYSGQAPDEAPENRIQ